MPTSTSRRNSPREQRPIRKSDVIVFQKLVGQLRSLKDEFAVLSKSKPDSLLNELKVSIVNERVREANELLTGEFKPLASFTEFDAAKLPSNSDVQLVLSQYLEAFERWRSAHVAQIGGVYGGWRWMVKDDGDIEANAPTYTRP